MYFHSPSARDNTDNTVATREISHADPCNKSYISREISIEHPGVVLASLPNYVVEGKGLAHCHRASRSGLHAG